MKQFVVVQASKYNKSVTTQSVTKRELPNCKAEQPPTYQIDSLNLNKKMFGKADGVDTGVLISDFTLHLRRKNADVADIYFTLLDAAGISASLVFNQKAKAKDGGSWVPFKV